METKIKVAFYILNGDSIKARDLYACRLIEKAYNMARRIYVLTANAAEMQTFNTQLWTFRDVSFVPHLIYNNEPHYTETVLIGCNSCPPADNDVLVNLTPQVPTFYNQFKHVIELVINEEQCKTAGRNRYKFYQEQGCEMAMYKDI